MRLSMVFGLLLTQRIVKQQGMLEAAQMVTFYIFPNIYQQGWKGTFAHTSYAKVYWPLSPEAYEWKKKIQNLRMGHDDRRNPYL